jgi:tetratricopeptide (TPR) repeat protein
MSKPTSGPALSRSEALWRFATWAVIAAAGVGAAWSLYQVYAGYAAERLVVEGNTACANQKFTAAVESAERAISFRPKLADAWHLLADASSQAGQVERALEALSAYALLEPDDAGPLGVRLGIYWMKQNQTAPAIRSLRLAESVKASSLEAISLQEQIAAVTGHPRETVRCIIELLKRDAFSRGDMLIVTAMLPGLGDLTRLDAIIQADPANKAPLLARALHAISLNHVAEAERLLLEINAAHPDDREACTTLGELYAVSLPEKFPSWHAGVPERWSDDARVWSARGKWLSQAGETEPAIRCLYESLVREPEQLTTTAQLGQLLKSRKELALGSVFIERARRLQAIVDLNRRLNEPRASEFYWPMIRELEATGRLWEAWGWCVIHERAKLPSHPEIVACRERLRGQLHPSLPRTAPGSLPGSDFAWTRFPLPDWSTITVRGRATSPEPGGPRSGIRFEDRSDAVGLDVRYVNSYSPEAGRKIFETMGAGVAVLDFDRDGWPDLYLPQGQTTPTGGAGGPTDQLFRNQRGQRLVDVTASAGIQEFAYSQGVAAGDFDNDGFEDVYVANLGRNCLFHNNGDGTFSDVTEQVGLKQREWTVSCAIADLNGDGMPELFDANYAQGSDLFTRSCPDASGRKLVCRPTVFEATTDTVIHNLGDGRFQELQASAGLDLPQGMGMGLLIADFNADDRPDLFVANDMTANYLLINTQPGTGQPPRFQDEAFLRGVALDQFGLAQACMGVASADLNRDGAIDLFVTNFTQESNTLYLSQPGGLYLDQTQTAGLREPSFAVLGFGTQFFDADNDGWYDLAVLNGHIDDFGNEPYRMRPQFFRGSSDGRFEELPAAEVGPLFDQPRLGRGLALVDWNRDGRVDCVATDLEDPVMLVENQTRTTHRSMRLRLVGTGGSRDAIGAKVRIEVSPGVDRYFQITAGDGYEASNERLLHVGTEDLERVDAVEIRWPSGATTRKTGVDVEREWMVIEGREAWCELPTE